MLISEIIEAVNAFAPLGLQESWDNSGLQVGETAVECSGALLCVDISEAVLAEAHKRNCNLVVSHHPLLFRGLKQIAPGRSEVEKCVFNAIRDGITIFSSHTALDSAAEGISREMATMLGAKPLEPLMPSADSDTGLGCIAEFENAISGEEFAELVKTTFGAAMVRASRRRTAVKRIGMCGGSGGEFIPTAIAKGCDAYLTSEVKYHDFVDYGTRIFIADIGHFESEECSKEIFYRIISKKFPNFAVYKSDIERNPIIYI